VQALHFEWVKVLGSSLELTPMPPFVHFSTLQSLSSFLLPTQCKGAWIPKSGFWILLGELVPEAFYTAGCDFL